MRIAIASVVFVAITCLVPTLGFAWSDHEYPIDYVGVYTIYIDSNCVFCGTNADWGANMYGVFIMDRKTEQWKNYSIANSGINNSIVAIARVDSFIDVLARRGTLRFRPPSMDFVSVDTAVYHQRRFFRDSLVVGSRIYTVAGDSVVVKDSDRTFSIQVFKRDPGHETGGPIVTDFFLYDSSIILTTATLVYEHNIGAASGFLELSPLDSTVKPWSGIELSDKPLALICAEQDEKEFWIGTNRGVYCINKNTGKKTHYNITKGIVAVETLKVHSDVRRGRVHSEIGLVSPVIHEYHRGDTIILLKEHEFSMEVQLPQTYYGYLASIYVKDEIDDVERGRTVRIKDMLDLEEWGYVVAIKAADSWDSKTIAEFHYYNLPTGKQFEYISKHDDWYLITLPNTGWVPMKDLIFHMEEVENQ